jgi:hypothetical protein
MFETEAIACGLTMPPLTESQGVEMFETEAIACGLTMPPLTESQGVEMFETEAIACGLTPAHMYIMPPLTESQGVEMFETEAIACGLTVEAKRESVRQSEWILRTRRSVAAGPSRWTDAVSEGDAGRDDDDA